MLDAEEVKQKIQVEEQPKGGSKNEECETLYSSSQGAEGMSSPPAGDDIPSRTEGTNWCKYCLILVCVLLGLEEAMLLI